VQPRWQHGLLTAWHMADWQLENELVIDVYDIQFFLPSKF
jgi:hypothetical protein